MRRTTTWLILAFVCGGLVTVVNGIHAQGSTDSEGLFIPTVDNSWNEEGGGSLHWSADRRAGGVKARRSTTAKQPETPTESGEADRAATADGAWTAWMSDLPDPWAVWLVALGGLAAVSIPMLLLGRWILATRAGRAPASNWLGAGQRTRSSVPSVLAASLISTQSRSQEFAETAHNAELKKTRRAA